MIYYKDNKGFTLIEIMVGIIIVSIVLVGGFQALFAIAIGKTRLMNETDLQKESFYFTEKLFEMIKKGGTIDYEEYFNRKVIGNTTTSSGHYSIASGFGNFGSGGTVGTSTYGDNFYYCRSGNGIANKMTGSGCYNNILNNYTSSFDGKQQRYGEFSFQFIDYNSNYDSDLGNEDNDGSGNIIGDDDDEYLGLGPNTFSGGIDLKELYLLSGNKKERTYFRWNVKKDPNSPPGAICNTSNQVTGTGCLGNIEYLKLDGKDWGMSHDLSNTSDKTLFDGVIDTWLINPDFVGGGTQIAGTGAVNRIPLFPESINVSEFKIYAYPTNDVVLNWKNYNDNLNISPYVIIKMKIKPSWLSRKKIKGKLKDLDFSMTINLSDIYSQ